VKRLIYLLLGLYGLVAAIALLDEVLIRLMYWEPVERLVDWMGVEW
jgi:hypothetical protein